jgi:sialate O-acetylesterase
MIAPLLPYAIAGVIWYQGEANVFHPVLAWIHGNTVVVTSQAVPRPAAVRYGWANVPEGNLFNKSGLPASPFRTDGVPARSAAN